MKNYFFTSESVSEGHPDKVADQVSDAVLDAYLTQDSKSRVACETMISTGFVLLAGEISSKAQVDLPSVVRKTIQDIGYDHGEKGFDSRSCAVMVSLDQQSHDIAMGVNDDQHEQGAGDQGIMFGYATVETPQFMPLTIELSHRLVKELAQIRKTNEVSFLRPDAKSQVTVEYQNGKAVRIDSIVLSTQHSPDVDQKQIKELVMDLLLPRVVESRWLDDRTRYFINPTGRFVIGGPHGDCGLTGRKIIVDTYGGHGAHGGGAFSGKDPSKVDRSAAYASRHIAKNLVAAGAAERCLVQLSYAIGIAEPMSIYVNTYGTGTVSEERIVEIIRKLWNLKPAQIIQQFDLLKPRYLQTASYGHFGREGESFTWEKLDRVEEIRSHLNP